MLTQRDLLQYVKDAAPVPWSQILIHFRTNRTALARPMYRLRTRGFIRRINIKGEPPLWILTKAGQGRLEYYEQHEKDSDAGE